MEWEVVILDHLDEGLVSKAVSFLSSFLPSEMDPIWSVEHFKWKIKRNPVGKGYFICAVSNGNIVGTASITLKRIIYKGKNIVAGETGDTYSHPDFRKKGNQKKDNENKEKIKNKKSQYLKKSIFGRLVHENTLRAFDKGIRIIYGTPNENSRPGYEKRLNYKSHPIKEVVFYRPTVLGTKYIDKIHHLAKNNIIEKFISSLSNVEKLVVSAHYKYLKYKLRKHEYFKYL